MNISKSQLSTKSRQALAKALPRGAQKKIAAVLGIHPSLVSNALKGVGDNDAVIEEALRIIEERKAAVLSMEQRIKEATS